jgi:hypothetical protein
MNGRKTVVVLLEGLFKISSMRLESVGKGCGSEIANDPLMPAAGEA